VDFRVADVRKVWTANVGAAPQGVAGKGNAQFDPLTAILAQEFADRVLLNIDAGRRIKPNPRGVILKAVQILGVRPERQARGAGPEQIPWSVLPERAPHPGIETAGRFQAQRGSANLHPAHVIIHADRSFARPAAPSRRRQLGPFICCRRQNRQVRNRRAGRGQHRNGAPTAARGQEGAASFPRQV